MEAASRRWTAVGVDAHDGVRVQRVGHLGAFVHAGPQCIVVAARHRGPYAQRGELGADAQHGVPGEGVFGVAVVGRGSAGLAVLGTTASGGHLATDGRVVGSVVAGVEEHDHAGDVGRRGGGHRGVDGCRSDQQTGGHGGADTQAGGYWHPAKVAAERLPLRTESHVRRAVQPSRDQDARGLSCNPEASPTCRRCSHRRNKCSSS